MADRQRTPGPSAAVRRQLAARERWNRARSRDKADLFTLSYSGRTVAELIRVMREAGVKTLIDIRKNPVSLHRPDMSKSNLKGSMKRAGIAYVHAPELGVPRDVRAKAVQSNSRSAIWRWYDRNVIKPRFVGNLDWFSKGYAMPPALMCLEIDPRDCHRHRLARAFERKGLKSYDL
jgi:uncharacterized protein (DUF488 family)